jgi:hypothetical protein
MAAGIAGAAGLEKRAVSDPNEVRSTVTINRSDSRVEFPLALWEPITGRCDSSQFYL